LIGYGKSIGELKEGKLTEGLKVFDREGREEFGTFEYSNL